LLRGSLALCQRSERGRFRLLRTERPQRGTNARDPRPARADSEDATAASGPTCFAKRHKNRHMAVEIDTGVALRRMNDLRRLVEAVVGADENDELDWLEWKSTLDLSTKHGCFQVAKAVLGMANRAVEQAKLATPSTSKLSKIA